MCCDSWGCKELDTTEQLNRTEYVYINPKLPISPSSPPLPLANGKDLLENRGNSTQYSVVTYLGKELKNNGYVCN